MKVFTALMATETNTFCPIPTVLEDFEYGIGEQSMLADYFKAFGKVANDRGWEVQHGPAYFASPAGTIVRSAYETIKADLLKAIMEAMPMDALTLLLHGAMFAEGYPDCEGDFLKAVRDMVGPDMPVGVELDSHVHLTDAMVENADIIVIFKEWPHTDMLERAKETMEFTIDMAEKKIKPHMAVYDPRMIATIDTYKEPGRTLVDDIMAMEGKDGVLSISIGHSFAWADFPDVGNKVLVVTDNRPEKGKELAEQIGKRVFDLRNELGSTKTPLKEGLKILARNKKFPVLLSESFDCMAGGAGGDSTYLIKGLIEHGITGVFITHYWDPMAVDIALKAGEGTKLHMRIGGKSGPLAGDPVDMEVKVIKAIKGLVVNWEGEPYEVGDVALVRGHGIDIALNAQRDRNPIPEYLKALGYDSWWDAKISVIKGVAGPEKRAESALYLNLEGPGANSEDLMSFDYKNIGRPKWPFDENPFA